MVKAHSLLYAIYICLIVSILCGAMLYLASLYSQLNQYYNDYNELYIHNQSLVNLALGAPEYVEDYTDDNLIKSAYSEKQYGLLSVLIATSIKNRDTVASAHFTGSYTIDKTCIYLPTHSRPLTYSGSVVLAGDKWLPSDFVRGIYIDNRSNSLISTGAVNISTHILPELNKELDDFLNKVTGEELSKLSELDRKDSLYFNSFFNVSKHVDISAFNKSNIYLKGNVIVHSSDSIYLDNSMHMEDVILIAPKIRIGESFTGSIQAYASEKIYVEKNAKLLYPSVLCVRNLSTKPAGIKVSENSKIMGAVILYGNVISSIPKNIIEIEKESVIIGDLYCTGRLMLKSNVYGSVYTNNFFYKTDAAGYDNCITDVEINPKKRPEYYMSLSLFKASKNGSVKKVF